MKIWSVDSQENCGGAAGRLNSAQLREAGAYPKVPATWSNPETVEDLMGEVRARCMYKHYLQQLPPLREVHFSDNKRL